MRFTRRALLASTAALGLAGWQKGAPIPGPTGQTGVFQFRIAGVDWQEALTLQTQSSGRILVGGTMNFNVGTQWNPDVAQWQTVAKFLPYMLRLKTDGTLDTTFGAGGYANIDFPSATNHDSECTSLAVLPDDSIIMPFIFFEGPVSSGTSISNRVAKFTKDGILIPTWGTNGVVTLGTSGNTYCDTIFAGVQSNGNVIVGAPASVSGSHSTTVFALNPSDGSPHTTWGNQGAGNNKWVSPAGDYNPRSMKVLSNDKVMVGCIGPSGQFSIFRLNSDGTDDTGFNSTGQIDITVPNGNCSPYAGFLEEPSTGKVIVAGWAGYDVSGDGAMCLFRLNTNGTLDTTFGDASGGPGITLDHGGPQVYDQTVNSAVYYDANGKIILTGTSGTTNPGNGYHLPSFQFMLARYSAAGVPDTTFNSGSAFKPIDVSGLGSTDNQTSYGAFLWPDGRLMACGHYGSGINHGSLHTGANTKLWVARFSAAGVFDTTFGNNFTFSGSPPSVTTNAATGITTTTATANATITPAADATTWSFQYGKATGLYSNQTAAVSLGAGGGAQTPTASLTGLTSGAAYFGRAVAWSQLGGLTFGAEVTWTQL